VPFEIPFTQPAYVFVLLFLVVLLAPLLAARARLPAIIGLILAGVLIGPNGAGLVARTGGIELLGGAGLLYLMFLAGADMDIEGFLEQQRDSLIYGVSTFVIPMLVNTAAALLLGLDLLAALLIASAFTSHTLVTYPTVQRFGLATRRSVTATIGATLLSTVAALLVLAIVAAAHVGDIGAAFWVRMILSLAAFLALTLVGLPRLTRWFFAGAGQDRMVRFAYILVVMFAISAVADLAGIQAIVGAFLAGLALNRFIPVGSVLMERVHFLGNAFLIPLFLISTGMLIDPVALVSEPRQLLLGAGFTAAAVGAKWLSVLPVGWLLGFDRNDRGLRTDLSAARAAGALAAAIVAERIGLIDQDVVNAVVLVILATSVIASVITSRYAPQVPRPPRRAATLGQTVVVPIANPRSAGPLVKIAALVAGSDSGSVIPVNILGFEADRDQVEDHRELAVEAEEVALRNGAEARAIVRIDASAATGVLHTVVESGATCLLMGWKGWANTRENFFGGIIDAVLAQVRVPTLVCRPGVDGTVRRIVLSVSAGDLTAAGRSSIELAADVAVRMAQQADVPLLVMSEQADERLDHLAGRIRRVDVAVDERKPPIALRDATGPGDVVVLGTPPTRAGLGQNAARVTRAIPDRSVVAAIPRLPD
jgi:Kef-type K+ transport system membrane component KefB